MANIKQRGNSYLITVSDGYSATGKQIRRTKTYTPATGLTAKQIDKEVKRQAVLFEEHVKTGQTISSGLKLSDLYQHWCENHVDVHLERKTRKGYTEKWKRIGKYLGHIRLDKLKVTDIQEFYTALQQKGVNHWTGEGVAVDGYHRCLNTMLNYGVRQGLIAQNPCSRVTKPKQSKKPQFALSTEQVKTLLDNLKYEPLEFALMFSIFTLCGLRRGEVFGLKWGDIEVDGKMWVRRSISYVEGEGLEVKETKTGEVHHTWLNDYALNILEQYRTEQQERIFNLGDRYNDEGFIFAQDNGQPRNPTNNQRKFKDFLRRCGFDEQTVKDTHLHTLRHTLASHGMQVMDVVTLAGLLGHANPNVTLRTYAHCLQGQSKAVLDIFADILPANNTHAIETEAVG